MIVTYEQVFGVPVGGELREGQSVAYSPCPAVRSLRRQLMAFPFFASANTLGGQGPLLRPGPKHEFNRHHAGLAVDIMLAQNSDQQVALGQQLVLAFWKLAGVMKWRGVIYQDVTLDLVGAARRAGRWGGGGHFDHIHIDWHNPINVQWRYGLSSVPYRTAGGVVKPVPVVDGHRIAEAITWSAEAMTVFEADAAVQKELADVTSRYSAGLKKVDLGSALGLTGAPTATAANDLIGTWRVTIGPWSGIFVFSSGGGAYWADSISSPRHQGKWSVIGLEAQWKFSDPGDFRTFVAPLPLLHSSTKGRILPAGQGFFEMKKA